MHDIHDLAALFPLQQPSLPPATALAHLSQEGVLSVHGPDATRFLQGQLTCDVTALQPGDNTLGARCNPKGRMQSSFRLLKRSEEEYLLALPRELLEAQQQDLAKYAAFFKVKLEDVSGLWVRLGLWGDNASAALNATGIADNAELGLALEVGADTHELWLPAPQSAALAATVKAHAEPVPTESWTRQMIRLGIGQVRAETRESFIPQMLNLQYLGGVSFRKGCYTGQEIVARMQYLGKLKRRMYRLDWESSELPLPGTAIQDSSTGQSVGEVVMAARAGSHIEMLAVLQNDAAELPTLSINNIIEPPLRLNTLPYEQQMAADPAAD
ncbi:MAG: folate-binding protein [Pseudomonas sp.]